jgi:hypothetical protein
LADRDVLTRLPAKINLKIKKYYFNIFLNKIILKTTAFFCRVLKTKSKVKCFYIGLKTEILVEPTQMRTNDIYYAVSHLKKKKT